MEIDAISGKNEIHGVVLITYYVYNGFWVEALELFYTLNQFKIHLDFIALISTLYFIFTLKKKKIHGFLIRKGFFLEGPIASSLVDMYDHSGNVEN